jgi:hypothetical protein
MMRATGIPRLSETPARSVPGDPCIYFPELLAETYAFNVAWLAELKLGFALRPELLATAVRDVDARKKALDGYRASLKQTTPVVLKAAKR